MRPAFVILGLALTVAAISPRHAHHSNHRHENRAAQELRKKDLVTQAVQVTVVECWLGKQKLSDVDCQDGIKNGTLKWADDGSLAAAPQTSVAYHTSKVSSSSKSSTSLSSGSKTSSSSTSSSPPSSSSSPAAKPTTPADVPPPKQTQSNPASTSSSSGYSSDSGSGVNKEFPDGKIDCSHFPSDYGAMPLDWLNLGGWASVQKPGVTVSAGYNDILGVTKAQCTGSGCCLEGSFCSYGCPEGYLKYQWPAMQGLTGQSVGGLECKGGKLYRTNKDVKTLCATGASGIKVMVQNKLSQNVAICRTNYPGDEKMSIPVDSQPGTTRQLACPDASTFYTWQGKVTSAQYYINMPGYSPEKACVWGEQGDDFGNFSPGNLGVGWTDGRAWLSITANHPTQMKATLPYTIELVGGDSKCRYRNGKYCSGDAYDNCSSEGCTVSSSGGTITYVLS